MSRVIFDGVHSHADSRKNVNTPSPNTFSDSFATTVSPYDLDSRHASVSSVSALTYMHVKGSPKFHHVNKVVATDVSTIVWWYELSVGIRVNNFVA